MLDWTGILHAFFNILAAGCLALVCPAQAETVTGLYQVREPVSRAGRRSPYRSHSKALDTLVLRLTGDPKAAQSPALAELARTRSKSSTRSAPRPGRRSRCWSISTRQHRAALRKAGLALWGSNRPSILGWWLNDSAEGSNLVGDGQASAQPLRRAAQHRGLPLRLPLADLQEQLVANAKQLEGNDPAPLRALRALRRRCLAGGACPRSRRQVAGQVAAVAGRPARAGQRRRCRPGRLADAVMLAVSNRLAPRYVPAGASSQLQVQVQGMNLQRYAELAACSSPMAPACRWPKAHPDLRVTGNRDQLRAQLGLAKLQELPPAGTAGAGHRRPRAASRAPAPAAAKPFDGLRFRW
jgi:hypothetical protein